MKNLSVRLLIAISILSTALNSCVPDNEVVADETETLSFVRDIRPIFFEKTNFDDQVIRAEIPQFLSEFKKTYDQLLIDYKSGHFKSDLDIENMRIASEYYSFYIFGLAGSYMDGDLTAKEILGNSEESIFSKAKISIKELEVKEIEMMINHGMKAAQIAKDIKGFNDRALGFYLLGRQTVERFKDRKNFYNNAVTQDSMINYTINPIQSYRILENWNLLMSMVTYTNYNDSTNTFQNRSMEKVFNFTNERIIPGTVRTGQLPDILGPLYRYDLYLKKADWLINSKATLTTSDMATLKMYLNTFSIISEYIETDRKAVLNAWKYKSTYDERKKQVEIIKKYFNSVQEGNALTKPHLKTYLNTLAFKKAYTCYGCHQKTGL